MALLKFKRSAVSGKVPALADLELGELAINTFDGKLYLRKDNGTASIVEVGAGAGSGVLSFNTRTGNVTLTSGDVTGALGYTPYNSSNPAGYITGINSGNVTTALGYTPANKAGDTFTGAITVNSGSHQVVIASDGNIEITRSGGGAYIDFKDSTGEDFDSRIQQSGTGFNLTGTVSAGNDFRAPIFYDSDNTGYYLDLNSTSYLYFLSLAGDEGLNVKGIRGQFSAGSDGQGISLFSNVDIGYPSGWGAGLGYTPTRGLSVYGGGRFAYSGSGFLSADTSVRGPIFYDSNNTGYYVDPNGTSNLASLVVANTINGSVSGLSGALRSEGYGDGNLTYYQTSGDFAGTTGWAHYIIANHGNGASYYNYMMRLPFWSAPQYRRQTGDTSSVTPWYTFLSTENFNQYAMPSGSSATNSVDVRAPIFIDSNNTAYYVDPSGDTVLAGNLFIGQAANASYIYMGDSDSGQRVIHNNSHRIGFLTQGGGWGSFCEDGGYWQSDYSVRAPIFYDSNDTGYYCDPNSTSVFNAGVAYSEWKFYSNKGSGVYLGSSSAPSLQAFSNDGGSAFMSFHRSNAYAVNMGLDPDNVLRIGGWSASSNRFQMDMSGNLTMAGNVTAYSDARLKKDVKTIDDALSLISKMRGVRYTRIDTEKPGTGVIAQEMLEVMPEVVQQGVGEDDTLSVAYGNLVGVLIEAIKELNNKVEDLEAKLRSE